MWPAGLDCRLKGEGRRAVLAHELAHLRRRDHWVRRLEMVAAVFHWWNPLFWLAFKWQPPPQSLKLRETP